MRLSKEQKKAKIVEGYRSGDSYKQLQKRYRVSSRDIAELVKGIDVECAICGRLKGKAHFHAHHPDRANRPNFTIPLCPSCHAKEEARIRKDRQNKPVTTGANLLTIPTKLVPTWSASTPITLPFGSSGSPRGKDLLIGIGIFLLIRMLLNNTQAMQHQYDNYERRPIMGLKTPH